MVLPCEHPFLSRMRDSADVVIRVDADRAIQEGFRFFESENGVILCGDDIPPRYLYPMYRPTGEGLTPVRAGDFPDVIFMRTEPRLLESVLKDGVGPMFFHRWSMTEETMHSYEYVVLIELDRAVLDGHSFFQTESGVVNCEVIPPEYLSFRI